MHVRDARLDDLPAMLDLWRHLEAAQSPYRVYPLVPDPMPVLEATFRAAIDDDRARALVAVEGDMIAGMAIAWLEEAGGMNDVRTLELSRVVVHPDLRGKGVGATLVGEAERFGRAHGARFMSARIFTGNRDAIVFWERLGFFSRYEQRVRPILDDEEAE